uniref:Uncharacterized protein n=1 Tax=Parascaris univalens TaxID=6257 RepID=A0A915C1A3_PARUN
FFCLNRRRLCQVFDASLVSEFVYPYSKERDIHYSQRAVTPYSGNAPVSCLAAANSVAEVPCKRVMPLHVETREPMTAGWCYMLCRFQRCMAKAINFLTSFAL